MPGSEIGRKLKIKKGAAVIAGVRTKTITINNVPVDVTTDDDDGARRLLEESGERHLDLSIEGLTKDDDLLAAAAGTGVLIGAYTIEFPSGAEITGDFRFNNLELGAEYNEAISFTAEVQNVGTWTYTPA